MFFNGSLVCFKDKYNSEDSFNFLYKVYSFSSGKVGITAGGNYYSSCLRKLREATEVEIQLNRRVGEYHTKTSLLKELYSHIDLEVGDKIRVLRECSPYYKKGTILQLQKKNDHCGWTFTSDTDKRHLGFRLASIHGDHLSEGFGWEKVMKCINEGKQIFKELYFKPTSVEQSLRLIKVLEGIGYVDYTQNINDLLIYTTTKGCILTLKKFSTFVKIEDISWLEKEYEELDLITINGSQYLKKDLDKALEKLNVYG